MYCLEECLHFLKDKTPWEVKYHKHFLNTSKNYLEKITKSKYKCKVNIQLCAILSQLNRHESALIHGKKAFEKAKRAVSYCHEICKDHMVLHKKLVGYSRNKAQSAQYKLLESPHYIYFTNLVQFAMPIILTLLRIFESGVEFPEKKSPLSTYMAEWLMGFQIGDMMIIDYLDFNELKTRTGIDDEISTDLLLEKICFLTISSYCIGTEIRILSQQKFSRHTLESAKNFYLLSSKFCDFLPASSLLYSHIQITLTKYFGREYTEKKREKGEKEVNVEKVKRKSKSPEIEKIYKPKSLKIIRKVSPVKKNKEIKVVKPPSQRKDNINEVIARDRAFFEQLGTKFEPDPETTFE